MVDYKKAKDILEYSRQDQIKRFGTDELLLPFEPRLSNKKNSKIKNRPCKPSIQECLQIVKIGKFQ